METGPVEFSLTRLYRRTNGGVYEVSPLEKCTIQKKLKIS